MGKRYKTLQVCMCDYTQHEEVVEQWAGLVCVNAECLIARQHAYALSAEQAYKVKLWLRPKSHTVTVRTEFEQVTIGH